jgi:hypothetical protein
MKMTLENVLPATNLVGDGFDIDFIAGLLAVEDSPCKTEAGIVPTCWSPSELESHRAFMAGYEILTAFGMSM